MMMMMMMMMMKISSECVALTDPKGYLYCSNVVRGDDGDVDDDDDDDFCFS